MKLTFIAVLVSSIMVCGYPVSAGPFGIEVDGFTLDKYGCINAEGLYYKCVKIPSPHNAFELYVVRYHAEAGLCAIKGIGKDIVENGSGSTTKAKVDEIFSQVSQKYGKVEIFDFLSPTSIWTENDEWLMGVVKKDRSYFYLGDVSPPVEGIKQYVIAAEAISSDTGYVDIEFNTINVDKCEAAEASDGASKF
jgi:hypothetical protein